MLKRWMAELQRAKQSLEDDARPRRSITVATPEMASNFHDIVTADKQVTERYITSESGISQKGLETRKLYAH